LIRVALDAGARRLMIGVGGSSTNDGGAGMLVALGMSLVDADGRLIAPTPEGLASLAAVDARALDPRLGEATITIMSDVNNPLCGERGATAIFGPQKGLRRERIAEAAQLGVKGVAQRRLGDEEREVLRRRRIVVRIRCGFPDHVRHREYLIRQAVQIGGPYKSASPMMP